MAQLIVAAAGAAIGFAIPGVGAGIGWAIGSLVGSAFAPGQKSSGPRLSDLKVTAAEYGAPIPVTFGNPRVAGTVIWASEKRENATTESQGKGGGGAEYTSYTYEIDLLYLLADNTIEGVRRIWSNGKLIWSMAEESDPESIEASEDNVTWKAIRVYTGTGEQLPDPVYEAAVGVGNAPAYINRGTVMLEGVNLGSSGQLPNLTFELGYGASSMKTEFSMPYYDSLGPQDIIAPMLQHELPPDDSGRAIYSAGSGYTSTFANPEGDGKVGSVTYYTGPKLWDLLKQGKVLYIEVEAYITDQVGSAPTLWQRFIGLNGTHVAIGWRRKTEETVFGYVIGQDDYFHELSIVQGRFRFELERATVERTVLQWYDVTSKSWVELARRDGYCPDLQTNILVGNIDAYEGNRLGIGVKDVKGYYKGEDVKGSPLTPDPLQEVVTELCRMSGIESDRYSVSELGERLVRSMAVQPTSARAVLEQLAAAHYFECVESDRLYFRPRGGPVVALLPYEDLSADAQLMIQDGSDLEIAGQVNVTYINISNAHQQGNEVSDRVTTDSTAVSSIQLAIGMLPSEAKAIADTAVLDQVVASRTYSASVDSRLSEIEPCDVVLLQEKSGETHRGRIVKISDNGVVRALDIVGDDPRLLEVQGTTSEYYEDDHTVVPIAATDLALLDIPLLRDQDDNPGIYAAGDGRRGAWPGYILFRNGVEVGRTTTGAAMGIVTEALGNWNSLLIDESHVITVSLNPGDQLASITHAEMSTTISNYAAIGAPGRWEIVQYQRAALVSEGVYRVSGIARGRLGTEHLRGSHSSADKFIGLDGAGMLRDVANLSDMQVLRSYLAVTLGARMDTGTTATVIPNWQGLRPLSPVGARQLKNGEGDLVIQWGRRSRYANNILMGILPLAEAREYYEIDIIGAGGSVVRTIASTNTTATYTAAQQIADFGELKESVSARIYQLSASVGRGQPAIL